MELEAIKVYCKQLQEALNSNHNQMMETLPKKIFEAIEQHINGNGACTSSEIARIVNAALDAREYPRAIGSSPVASTPTFQLPTDGDGYQYYMWGERFREVPKDWKFQSGLRVKAAMDLFILGTNSPKVKPYNQLKSKLLPRSQQGAFTKASTIYKIIVKIAIDRKYSTANAFNEPIDLRTWDTVFTKAYGNLIDELQITGKSDTITCSTLYYKMPK